MKKQLVDFGRRLAQKGLTAGAGGNISVRDGQVVWIKPSGFALEDLTPADLCGIDLSSGQIIEGESRPTSEWQMHLAVYAARPDIKVVFHTHSPWAGGVISSGKPFKPMFVEVVVDLGGVAQVPYVRPGTKELAAAVAEAAGKHNTILMENHGVVALGESMRQAYSRCCLVEDAAISLVAATVVGKPHFLPDDEVAALSNLEIVAYRNSIARR